MDNNFEPNKSIGRSRSEPEILPKTDEIFEEIEFVKVIDDDNLKLSHHEDQFNCN